MKKEKYPEHLCGFNDFPSVCECYADGVKYEREKIRKDLLAVADAGEIEDLQREVLCYFKKLKYE